MGWSPPFPINTRPPDGTRRGSLPQSVSGFPSTGETLHPVGGVVRAKDMTTRHSTRNKLTATDCLTAGAFADVFMSAANGGIALGRAVRVRTERENAKKGWERVGPNDCTRAPLVPRAARQRIRTQMCTGTLKKQECIARDVF